MAREIVVVDCESTGLHDEAVIVELAAINLRTGEELLIVPEVSQEALGKAQPEAIRLNRYYERGLFKETTPSFLEYDLRDWLRGNTLAGSNPAFDANLLAHHDVSGVYGRADPLGPVWHHRLLDLSAYAAGVLGLPPTELPGLHKVCELVGVENEGEHTALGDARATAECFRRLMAIGGMSDRTREDLLEEAGYV